MKLQDFMVKDVVTLSPDETITAAAQTMSEKRIGCLVITADGLIKGILTDRDLLGCLALAHDSQDCRVAVHMTASVVVERPDEELLRARYRRAITLLAARPISRLGPGCAEPHC